MSPIRLQLLQAQQRWRERRYRVQEFHGHAALEEYHTILHQLQELTNELKALHQKFNCLWEQHRRYIENGPKSMMSIMNNGGERRCVHRTPRRQNPLPPVREESVGKESQMETLTFPVSFMRNETAREAI
ncbi:hypothetical protein B0H14DRAFT_3147049 [Mycena olivaceomarginata]|nr:hypothetical protein B0H14DRAFT_3147049 [Mycena olivaceomarginata]